MALLGRGRYPWSYRKTVESSLVLSVKCLREWGFLPPVNGTSGQLKWTCSRHEKREVSIGFAIYDHFIHRCWVLNLYFYRLNPIHGTSELKTQLVFLQTTRPNFGGIRYWLTCPSCGSMFAKLYLPPSETEFACRSCHDLVYQSQRESSWMRVERRAQKILHRVGGGPSVLDSFPPKPKHMHWNTYSGLEASFLKAKRHVITTGLRRFATELYDSTLHEDKVDEKTNTAELKRGTLVCL